MLYFEFNRSGGKEKYSPLTEAEFKQAQTQEGRYFIWYASSSFVPILLANSLAMYAGRSKTESLSSSSEILIAVPTL